MNKPLSCAAQDLLEAAIIQRRRLNIICSADGAPKTVFNKVLPVDLVTQNHAEQLIILTSDNEGGILRLNIDTSDIFEFEAKDFKDPRIHFSRDFDPNCSL